MENEKDPREELAELAGALASEARRRRQRGLRSVPASDAPRREPTDADPRASADPSQPAPQPRVRPSASSQADFTIPASRPRPPAAAPVLAPIVHAAKNPALDAARKNADEIRTKAQACADLDALARAVAECTACGLCRTRTQTVFADGVDRGKGRVPVMFVGEAPGENEDLQGVPFVGRAGALLTDIITKGMGLAREDVSIVNVLKCRPPDNRDPTEEEKLLCTPWLDRQIELVDPRVIIPLGRHAAMHVLGIEASMGALRGRVHDRNGRKVVPTYHPAFLLRSPDKKKECWQDIQLAMQELGLKPPPRASRP
jgi:DNA polymerase